MLFVCLLVLFLFCCCLVLSYIFCKYAQTGEEHCKNLLGPVGLWEPLAECTVHHSASRGRFFPSTEETHRLCFECPVQVNDEMVCPVRLR